MSHYRKKEQHTVTRERYFMRRTFSDWSQLPCLSIYSAILFKVRVFVLLAWTHCLQQLPFFRLHLSQCNQDSSDSQICLVIKLATRPTWHKVLGGMDHLKWEMRLIWDGFREGHLLQANQFTITFIDLGSRPKTLLINPIGKWWCADADGYQYPPIGIYANTKVIYPWTTCHSIVHP